MQSACRTRSLVSHSPELPRAASVKTRVPNTSGDLSRDRIGPRTRVHANTILRGAANGGIFKEREAGEIRPYDPWA